MSEGADSVVDWQSQARTLEQERDALRNELLEWKKALAEVAIPLEAFNAAMQGSPLMHPDLKRDLAAAIKHLRALLRDDQTQ